MMSWHVFISDATTYKQSTTKNVRLVLTCYSFNKTVATIICKNFIILNNHKIVSLFKEPSFFYRWNRWIFQIKYTAQVCNQCLNWNGVEKDGALRLWLMLTASRSVLRCHFLEKKNYRVS